MNARYYNSTYGRFTSQDASFLAIGDYNKLGELTGQDLQTYLQDPQQLNSYSYARNNPLVNTDPTGQSTAILGGLSRQDLKEAAQALAGATIAAVGSEVVLTVGGATIIVGGATALIAITPSYPGESYTTQASLLQVSNSGTFSDNKDDQILVGPVMQSGFTPKTKEKAREEANGKCTYCGQSTTPAKKSQKGVTPPGDQGETDHYDPKSKGGSNEPDNAKHSCRDCNQAKGDTSPKGTKWEVPTNSKPDN